MKDMHAGNGEQASKHDKFALREVNDIGGVVYDIKTHTDKSIDRSDGYTGNEVLEYLLG